MTKLQFPARATDSRWICLVWLALVLGAAVTTRGHVDETRVPAGSTEGQGLNAGFFTVYGPETFTRSTGAPVTEERTFAAANRASKFTLRIETFTAQGDGDTTAVASALIRLNGTVVAAPADFSAERRVIEKSVELRATNQLTVEVRGKPGARIVINIFALDEDLPTIVATASPAPNANGWNNTPVSVTFVCSDATSGVASCPPPVLVDREGAQQVVTGEVVDRAGHRATATITVNIDRTAPVVSGAVDPAPNAAGWHRNAATVSFTATDALSGIAPGSVTPPVTLSNDGSNQSARGEARDLAGNTASTTIDGINIDRTAPALSVQLSPEANANGWRGGPVTARFTCSDTGSGIVSCPPDQVVSTDGQNQTVTATVSDRAGNTATVTSAPFNIDATPPTISATMDPLPNAAGWHNVPVTVTFTCADAGGAVPTCPQPRTIAADGEGQVVTGEARDAAGHSATASVTVNVDRTPPVLQFSAPPANAVLSAAPVTVSASVADALSGVVSASCNGAPAVPGGGLIQCAVTLTPGANAITAAAADAAGNTATATLPLTLQTAPEVEITNPDGQTITLPAAATLTAVITDDGLPANALTIAWSLVSGPGPVTFGSPSSAATTATFTQPGTYALRVSASDGALSASDTVNLVVAPEPPPPNQAPQVNAGADQTITLPENQIALAATATDDGLPAGSTLALTWTRDSGPATVTFANAGSASTSATFTAAGTYVLRLTATDGDATAFDTVTVTVNTPANQAPQVNAGADQTITLPASQVALVATATDDGLPAGSTLALTWTRDSGPATVTFANAAAASTTATFTTAGTYVLRLTATDGDATAFDTVTVTVNTPANQAPQVNAGADQTITLPNQAALAATATDDGLPAGSTLAVTWTRDSGPATVTFANAAAASTTATFTTAGTYVLRLTATDGDATVFDTLTVVVNPQPNQAPQVNAGADQTIVLPAPASLSGTAVDDGLPAGALTYAWTRVSGPGGVIFGSASSPATIATFGQAGTYVLRLTVSDSALSVSDEVTIVADNPPPPPPPTNTAPVAHAGGPYAAAVNAPVAFSGLLSRDPDNDLLTYAWDFGDGGKGTGAAPIHAYDRDGSFTVTLTVSDGRGGSHTATASVTIAGQADRAPPVVTLTAPAEVLPGTDVKVIAQAVDNVGVTGLTFDVNGTNPSEAQAPPFERTISVPPIASPGSVITVRAIARDAQGNTGSAQAKITVVGVPDTAPPAVALNAPVETSPGTTLRLTASASDNVGVASVEFLIGSTRVALDTSAPYEASYPVPQSAQVGSQLRFTARAFDYTGNRGEADASVTVIQAPDNTPPTVALTAPPQALAGSAILLSAEPNDNAGIASVTFVIDGVPVATRSQAPYRVDFVVPAGIEAGALIDIVARAVDFSGLEGSDSKRVRVVTAGEGVISGEVYDDATGLPLAGATVALSGEDNQGRAYTQTATSDERGRYLLRAADGQGRLRVAKSGWTAVDRLVTLQSGRAVEPIDARLTLRSRSLSITAVLGGNVADARPSLPAGGTRARLRVDPGVLTADTAISVTELSAQGLQALLPPGWSPVAVVDIAPHGVPFAGESRVSVPNRTAIEAGRPLVVVRWDEAASAWRAVASSTAPATGTDLEIGVQSSGEYAWLAADAAPAVPPVPAIGDVIAGVAPALIPAGAATAVNPQPKIVLYKPGIRSDVRALVDPAAPITSGALLLAQINESYLTDAGEARPEPFVQDLLVYQTATTGTSMSAAFPVTPSLTFEPLSFQHGVITVELQAPDADGRDFAVIGPDGGAVAAATGELLEVPAGAAAAATAAHVSAIETSELGLDIGPGLELLAAVSVNLSGTELTRSALLSIKRPAHIATSEGLLVVRLQHVAGATRLVLIGTARVAGERIFSDTALPGSTIALEGVTAGGRYLFVRAIAPLGFAAGRVLGVGGQPFTGAVISSSTLPLIARSRNGGSYVAAASAGAAVLTAVDLTRNDKGSSQGAITANQVAAVDLRLETERPRVLTISPAAGAVNVAPTSPIVAKFSEPIDPASVSGANAANVRVTPAGGSPVAGTVTLSANNTTLTFRPLQPLAANTSYTVTLAQAITDAAGNPLESPFVATFTSLDTTAPPKPPAGSITASIPQNGTTTIVAAPGTAAAHDTVTVVNLTKGTFTPVLVNANGGFEVVVPADLQDKLQIRIVDQAGNETIVGLAAFSRVNPDGSRSTVVGVEGGRAEGPNGIAVDVPEGAFDAATVVTIKSVPESEFPVQLTAEQRELFGFTAGLTLDFGGATPKTDVDVSITPSGGETPQDRWIVGAVAKVDDMSFLNVVDTARLIDGRIRTSSPPCPGVRADGFLGIVKPVLAMSVAYGQLASEQDTFGLPLVASHYRTSLHTTALPYQLLASPSSKQHCIPVLSGLVTVTSNSVKVVMQADQFTPRDRAVRIRNAATGAEQFYPRNVVEYRFQVSGARTDKYQVAVVANGQEVIVPSKVNPAGPGTVVVRVDVDKVHVSVTEVRVRNLSVTPVATTTFPQSTAAVSIPVAGGAGDGFVVTIVDVDGRERTGAHAIQAPPGDGNLVARALPGTVPPNLNVFVVNTANNSAIQIPPAAIVDRGFTYPFPGDPDGQYRMELRQPDGAVFDFLEIPSARLIVTNSATGRVLKTLTLQVPPDDDPYFNLGTIVGDTHPPMLVGAPPSLHSFDPSGVLSFTFSEGIDRLSAIINFTLTDEQGQAVPAEVRMSNGNRTVTLVPVAGLRMGARYSLRLDGLRDAAGNAVTSPPLTIRTFQPRPAGPPLADPQIGLVKDLLLLRNTDGSKSHVFTISQGPNTIIGYDVTDPTSPVRVSGLVSDGTPARGAILPNVKNLPLRRPNPCAGGAPSFSGDLAFVVRTFYRSTDAIHSHTNSMLMLDVTNPLAPCTIGIKVLGQGGLDEPDRSAGVIQKAGTAMAVTALQLTGKVFAYTAVTGVGLLATDVGYNAGEFSYAEQRVEQMVPGDFIDVVAAGNQLAAIQQSGNEGSIEFYDASLALLHRLSVGLFQPRRLAYAEAMLLDVDGDGVIGSNEALNLLFVGLNRGVLVIDVTDPGNPVSRGVINLATSVYELDIDREKRRLFAGGIRPAQANDWGVSLIDLSGPRPFQPKDADQNGLDDRVLWESPGGLYGGGTGYRGLRFDPSRRVLHVGVPPGPTGGGGFATWALDNLCCDLAVDFTAEETRRPGGTLEQLLTLEKKALKKGIEAGLDAAASCGVPLLGSGPPPAGADAVSILAQGSGACLWKSNPLESCARDYHPGVSDQDFEVLVPAKYHAASSDTSGASCVAQKLSDQFRYPDGTPKEIAVDGVTLTFGDITFFPFVREHFESAKLNIDPPKNSDGDADGDLGLGRQQLALLWLLTGEYVSLDKYSVEGRSLDAILDDLRKTGIPELEGHEWATLQRFNLLKSKAFLRIKGADDSESAFHDLFVKQVRASAKAGIRSVLARMVADPVASPLILQVRRTIDSPGFFPAYTSSACLSIPSADTSQWQFKPCEGFEEYIASIAGMSVMAGMPLFTATEVYNTIHRFWRIKGGIDSIDSEEEAVPFIAEVSNFIGGIGGDIDPEGGVIAATRAAYDQTVGLPDTTPPPDPQRTPAARQANLEAAHRKIVKAGTSADLPLVPRVANEGFIAANDVVVEMYRGQGTAPGTPVTPEGLSPFRVSLVGHEQRFLARSGDPTILPHSAAATPAERNLNDLPAQGNDRQLPLFSLGDGFACKADPNSPRCQSNPLINLRPAGPRWVGFTIDLPERKQEEADRQNNFDGFFYYVLDRANPTVPATPDKVPLPIPDPTGTVLDPDEACELPPELEVSQTMRVTKPDGTVETYSSTATLAPGQAATLEFAVQNNGATPATAVQVCSSLTTPRCHPVPDVPASAAKTVPVPYTAPLEATIVEGTLTVTSSTTINVGPVLRVIVGCEAYSVVELDPNPNPAVSAVMQGGEFIRYYRVIDRFSGMPLPNVPVVLQVGAPTDPNSTLLTFTTNAAGVISTGGKDGMAVKYDARFPLETPIPARFAGIGTTSSCAWATAFTFVQQPRAWSSALKAGTDIQAELTFEGIKGRLKNVFGSTFKTDSTTKGDKYTALKRSFSGANAVGVGVGNKQKIEIGIEASGGETSASAYVGPMFQTQTEHTFTAPLQSSDHLVIAALVTTGVAFSVATAPTGVASPILIQVLDAAFDLVSGVNEDRTLLGASYGIASEGSATARGASVTLGKGNTVNPDVNTGLGYNFGVSGAFDAAVLASADLLMPKPGPGQAPKNEVRASLEYRASVDLSAGLRVGISKVEEEAAKPGAVLTPKDARENLPAAVNRILNSFLLGSASLAGNVKFSASFDAGNSDLTNVTISVAERKRFGFKFVGNELINEGDGKLRTVTFKVTDKAKLPKALEQMALVQAVQLVGPITRPLHSIGLTPDVLGEEIAKLISLADEYEVTIERGQGVDFPFKLGDGIKNDQFSLGAKFALKFDGSASYVTERGAVKRGGMYKLEGYPEIDPLVPTTGPEKFIAILRDVNKLADAATTALKKGEKLIETGIGALRSVLHQEFSPSGVTLEVDGAAEPAAAPPLLIELLAFQYRGTPAPAGPYIRNPADPSGPADTPHYGIGGFFQFLPDNRPLAAPARMTIRYLDSEVAGFDEGTLAIYRWNQERSDWDHVGGVVDATANSVSVDITTLGFYTVGVPMPAGPITFTAQVSGGADAQSPTTATYTSGIIRMNTGAVVPDGTVFTVFSLAPGAATFAPLGTINTTDVDPNNHGVQVRSTGGVIQFSATYSAGVRTPRALGFALRGTAVGDHIVDLRPPQ